MKFVTKEGNIEEGYSLSDEELEILEDPIFKSTTFNTAIPGSFIPDRSIKAIIVYFIANFELRRRRDSIKDAEFEDALKASGVNLTA